MAAYAALVSLKHIIDQIDCHPSLPISLHKQQMQSLTQKVNFLQKFLEAYNSPFDYTDEPDPLEIRIADAAHAAEDLIEAEIVCQIRFTILWNVANFLKRLLQCDYAGLRYGFNHDLHNVIQDMDSIKKEASEKVLAQPQLRRIVSAGSTESSSDAMVGFDKELLQLLDLLTGGNANRQIIPIVGMGGIGKTTLAKNILVHPVVKDHFDVCAWATISQDYNVKDIFYEILTSIRGNSRGKNENENESENELGEEIYKYLSGRRYLIIMDDMWSIDVWDKVKFFFSEYSDNGSRILVTTRMSNLAAQLADSTGLLEMKFLDKGNAWNLFSETVFGGKSFPVELKQCGEGIVEKCNGLPLSIVVIGGLLAKSEHSLEYWEPIERNLSSMVNSQNDEYSLRILKLSYSYLPAYLKPCFLYMGMFKEDVAIRVSTLVKLWVSEGFLKPRSNKCLEIVAEEYLKELVDRNLILVDKLGLCGNLKYCKIHDLLRDLCLKEAQKQRFYYVIRENDPPGLEMQRRIVIFTSYDLKWMSYARSFVCHSYFVRELPDSIFLRTLNTCEHGSEHSLGQLFLFVNSRYISDNVYSNSEFPSSVSQLWNLHVLIIRSAGSFNGPIEIWKMPQLRHVEFKNAVLYLPEPPTSKDDATIIILKNLHTLKGVHNLILNEDVVERIPKIKKLRISYDWKLVNGAKCLSSLRCLENLHCSFYGSNKYLPEISFPQSILKLTLVVTSSFDQLEEVLQTIGSLPYLEKLVLEGGRFRTREWETIEGQFPSLKLLSLSQCLDLENWTMLDSSHFPCLEVLCLIKLRGSVEIPLEFGEVATLKSILVDLCSESVVVSAKRIVDEHEDLYGEHLDLHVKS